MTTCDVIKLINELLKIEFLTDLADWYIKLVGLVRGFQIIFTFCSSTNMTIYKWLWSHTNFKKTY